LVRHSATLAQPQNRGHMLILLIRCLLRLLYRFRIYNEEALRTNGPVLLLANHVSWWDWLFLGVCLEEDWRFVTSSITSELSWVHKRIMVNRRTFPVDMNSPYAVKHMAAYLHTGGRLVLFPEGRMSTTGSLMKFFEGTGFLTSRTHAKVITAYIRGAARLPFSPNPNRKQWFPRVSVHFSSVLEPPRAEHIPSSEARATFTTWLRDVMHQQQFETEMACGAQTLPAAILETARKRRRTAILEDTTTKQLTYGKLVLGATVLAAEWSCLLETEPGRRVGLLLPNINAFPAVLLSLWLKNKVPAILNYSTGPAMLASCARLAGLKEVITSRRFLERAELDVRPLQAQGIRLIYLEDVRAGITFWARLKGVFRAWFQIGHAALPISPPDTALVLFTSGSEGDPKGVELSHRNILANIRQMLSVVDLVDRDRFFNALPLFHSFGLTIGLLLPLVQGTFVFLYLSPLHYRIIPAAFYALDCTVLFGTNTFLSAYGRKAHPYDFRTLRYAFAGAERLHPATLSEWMHKFGVRILEGYGATECSPCVTVNVPMHSRPGSAGRFLPAIQHRIEHVDGIEERQNAPYSHQSDPAEHSTARASHSTLHCGRLFVRGPNVMRGYLNDEANRQFQALNGWYDTGDIVGIDGDGFVFILGRLKRFAKIGGEMISLVAVEEALAGAFPQFGPRFSIAVVARPDPARGERLVAITNQPNLSLAQLRDAVQASGLSNLSIPASIQLIAELPHLATGKVNHRELEKLVSSSEHA
jgi:acyl-[acyl-carrier-protein]-phospholipid O-acyltransferase / long-chain-fatty-acid--[acyl-carrier-protein] ligase